MIGVIGLGCNSEVDSSVWAVASSKDCLRSISFVHSFAVITIAHNHFPSRPEIHDHLEQNGCRREFEHISKWDDWYVLEGSDTSTHKSKLRSSLSEVAAIQSS